MHNLLNTKIIKINYEQKDIQLQILLEQERQRQRYGINLIVLENYARLSELKASK